jgi:hypothetical protein
MMSERDQRMVVRLHSVVGKESAHYLPQPLSLLWDRLMPSLPQLLFDFLELRLHAVTSRLSAQQELTLFRLAAEEGATRKLKVSGLRVCALRC